MLMSSDAEKVSSTGDLSDFEYDSSVYDPLSSSSFGAGPASVDPFSMGPSWGAKMSVPDTIALVRDDEMHNYRLSDKMYSANQAAAMSIPDRISLDGGSVRDRGVAAMRSVLPEDKVMAAFSDADILTPPRHLTLEQVAFPSVSDQSGNRSKGASKGSRSKEYEVTSSGRKKVKISMNNEAVYNDSVFQDSAEDVLALRKQVLALSRKMAAVEQENKQRVIRENYYMYSLACLATVTLYLLFRR